MSISLTDIRQRLEELGKRQLPPPEEPDPPPPSMARPMPPPPRARPPRSAAEIAHEIGDHDAEIMRLCNELMRVSNRRQDAMDELQIVLQADTAKAQRMLNSSERIWEYFFGPRQSTSTNGASAQAGDTSESETTEPQIAAG